MSTDIQVIQMRTNPLVKVWKLGRMGYEPALKLQKLIAGLHHTTEPIPNSLLVLEHNPVYTIGIRTKDYTEDDENMLKRTGTT